ncbi:hypothetical protein [Flavobacterium sp.]|uniref:hypothetical protein n=1 Tax=Flavobacterium sp. TaxID=239 RepID=UPI0035287BCA
MTITLSSLKEKGTKNGYKIPFKNISLGNGYDLVHQFAGEIITKMEFIDDKNDSIK